MADKRKFAPSIRRKPRSRVFFSKEKSFQDLAHSVEADYIASEAKLNEVKAAELQKSLQTAWYY